MRDWSKTNIFNLHLKKINPFGIHEPCIKKENNELIFEQYIMALNWDKYDIEVQNDDVIKRNQIFFDFMQQTLNCLDVLYLREKCILMDKIMKDQFLLHSASSIDLS